MEFNKGPFIAEIYRTKNQEIIDTLTASAKNWKPEWFFEDGDYDHMHALGSWPGDRGQPQPGDVVLLIDERPQSDNPIGTIVGRYVFGGNGEVLPLAQVSTDDWYLKHYHAWYSN